MFQIKVNTCKINFELSNKIFALLFITANWLCSKLLVTYPDRGDQANHFWYFFLFLSFLTQLSSAQLRGISAKFHINIFYSSWPPPMDKTIKKFYVSQYYTSALGSTVKYGIEIFRQFFRKLIDNTSNIAWICGKIFQNYNSSTQQHPNSNFVFVLDQKWPNIFTKFGHNI